MGRVLRFGCLAAPVLLLSGCTFDVSGLGWSGGDSDAGPGDARPPAIDAVAQPDAVPFGPPDAAGPNCDPAACPLGCDLSLDRCARLDPTNFDVGSFYDDLSGTLDVAEDVTVNTDTGEISGTSTTYRPAGQAGQAANGIYFDVVGQPDGPDLAVFGMAEIDLASNVRMTVVGSHPAAFYAAGDITIGGMVAAWGWSHEPGPGGGAGATTSGADAPACNSGGQGRGGGQAGSGGDQIEAGGGGGGFGASGGAGGDASYFNSFAAGGAGGSASAPTSGASPLRGGCGGGAGGGPDTAGSEPNDGGNGGGGGGGVQFSSGRVLTIAGAGVIDVGGGQGQGGQHGAGGGGGGSGGAVLLEGADVLISSVVVANGGGGGAGAPNIGANGEDGEAANQTTTPARGGTGYSYGGSGGNGAAGSTYAGSAGATNANGGGGGGSAGVLAINYRNTVGTSGILSPDNVFVHHGVATW